MRMRTVLHWAWSPWTTTTSFNVTTIPLIAVKFFTLFLCESVCVENFIVSENFIDFWWWWQIFLRGQSKCRRLKSGMNTGKDMLSYICFCIVCFCFYLCIWVLSVRWGLEILIFIFFWKMNVARNCVMYFWISFLECTKFIWSLEECIVSLENFFSR